MVKRFTARKYDGDDRYSWAVFYAKDVCGIRGIIFYGQATPIVSGLDRTSALYESSRLEKKEEGHGTT